MLSPFVRENLSRLQLAATTDTNSLVARVYESAPRSFDAGSLQGIEVENEQGRYWRVEQSLRSLWREVDGCVNATLAHPDPDFDMAVKRDDMTTFARHFPGAVLYLDLETCGFSGSAIFLIGTLHWQQNEWFLTQLFARDYSEEPAILQALDGLTTGNAVLVTFNGKSFDGPMMEDRQTLHRLSRGKSP